MGQNYNIKKVYFQEVYKRILMRRHILSTDTLYILHPYKQTTEYISKKGSQQAGGTLFS